MYRTINTLLIIPVYNSSAYLEELIERLAGQFDSEHILFLNDGSTDGSLEIFKKSNSHYLSFDKNRGKGAVLIEGFNYAIKHKYDYVITMDSDLQHRPEEIPRFLDRLDTIEAGEIIIGKRQIGGTNMPLHRRLSNQLTSALISIFSNTKISDSQCGFRLISLNSLSRLRLNSGGFQLESELLLKAGMAGEKVTQVPISTVYNNAPSSINHLGDTLKFIGQIWRRIWL